MLGRYTILTLEILGFDCFNKILPYFPQVILFSAKVLTSDDLLYPRCSCTIILGF